MNRRAFLSAVGLGAAGFALDLERLLWRPGAKTLFLPSLETLYRPQYGDLVLVDTARLRQLPHWQDSNGCGFVMVPMQAVKPIKSGGNGCIGVYTSGGKGGAFVQTYGPTSVSVVPTPTDDRVWFTRVMETDNIWTE